MNLASYYSILLNTLCVPEAWGIHYFHWRVAIVAFYAVDSNLLCLTLGLRLPRLLYYYFISKAVFKFDPHYEVDKEIQKSRLARSCLPDYH